MSDIIKEWYEKGVIYTPEDGTILHCLCKNETE